MIRLVIHQTFLVACVWSIHVTVRVDMNCLLVQVLEGWTYTISKSTTFLQA